MKKHFLKSFALIAMLFSAITMSAKQYCGEAMTSTIGWDGQYELSAEKVSDTQSRLTISATGGEQITGFYQLIIQNLGGGTASKWIFDPNDADFSNAELFSIAADGKSAVININWTTYPTSDIQVHMILRRNNSAGGSDIFGNTITDLNLLTACGGSGEIYDVNFALASNGSSAEATSGNANEAIDNNAGSRWESAAEDPQTWTLDLGQARIFNTLEIVWEGAYGKTFTVSVSDDKATWTPVWTVEGQQLAGFPYTQTQKIDKTTARYIQFHGTERGTGYGYSFWEFRVFLLGETTLTTLEASPATPYMHMGEENVITVTAKDQIGKVMENAGEVAYTISPVEAGVINGNVFTPSQNGTATIVAAIGDVKSAPFEIITYVSQLASFEAKPVNGLAKVGEVINIDVTAKDQYGQVMETPDGVTYTITPTDAGTITNNIYTPAKIGLATIVATIGDVSAPAFEVFAYDGENVALSPDINNSKIVAQSEFAPSGTDAWHAIDGNEGSVWQGSATNGGADDEVSRTYDSWFVVDFGAYYDINLVSINFEGACSQEYTVAFSADNATWSTAYEYVGNAGIYAHTKLIYGNDLQNNTKVRYARFYSTKAATQWGVKMFEFKVFGTPWVAPADDVKPVMGTATLVSNTHNTAVIAVTATDNEEVGKYHVVSADPAYDKMLVSTDGKIIVTDLTPSTEYALTITAVDLAGNESENAVTVAVTTAKYDIAPSALPDAPNYPANQVKAVYSDTYEADCNFGEWESGTQYTQDTYGKKYVTIAGGYFGLVDFALNCSNMEALHLDVWTADDMTFRVVPIHGAAEVGVTVSLKGQQWNSVEIPLSDYVGVPDWTNVYQIKIDNASNRTFWLNNIYFYTTQAPDTDDEAPTAVTATATASLLSVTIHAQATDNSGVVVYEVKNGEEIVATRTGISAANTDILVGNLTPNTEYNFTLIAKDEAANEAEPVVVTATTTALPAPASAPTHAADSVMSIYSDAYTPEWTTLNSFNEGWWNAPQMAEVELTEGDNALYYFGFTDGMVGWQFAAFNATGYTTFTMDIYPLADGTITCGPLGEGGADYAVTAVAVKGNQWNTITIDLTDKDLTAIFQVKMIDYYALGSFIVDNVYLYKPAALNPGTAVENTQVDVQSHKLIRNGVLYIIRNGVTYDVMGRVVR